EQLGGLARDLIRPVHHRPHDQDDDGSHRDAKRQRGGPERADGANSAGGGVGSDLSTMTPPAPRSKFRRSTCSMEQRVPGSDVKHAEGYESGREEQFISHWQRRRELVDDDGDAQDHRPPQTGHPEKDHGYHEGRAASKTAETVARASDS